MFPATRRARHYMHVISARAETNASDPEKRQIATQTPTLDQKRNAPFSDDLVLPASDLGISLFIALDEAAVSPSGAGDTGGDSLETGVERLDAIYPSPSVSEPFYNANRFLLPLASEASFLPAPELSCAYAQSRARVSVHLSSNMRIRVVCCSVAETCPRSST